MLTFVFCHIVLFFFLFFVAQKGRPYFKFVLTPGALDEYNDDDEDFRDDGEED